MSKNTIGEFIAALRKASGMTQRELAERLNVTDKSVSRWERDETVPDLTLIPVIAEIFGVTADELLRGERSAPALEGSEAKNSPRGEKQLERIINHSVLKFKVVSLVSAGLILLGLIAAAVCDLGFLRAYIGFFAGLLLILAAVITESVAAVVSFSSLSGEEFPPERTLSPRGTLFRLAALVYTAALTALAFCLPLMEVNDAYLGLTADTWIREGIRCAAAGFILAALIRWISERAAAGRLIPQPPKGLGRLRVLTAALLLALWAVTLIGASIYDANFDIYKYCKEYTFEEFKTLVETDEDGIPDSSYDYTYVDEEGNEVTREEYLTEYLTDETGRELPEYKFIHRNYEVYGYSTRWENGVPTILAYEVPYTNAAGHELYLAHQTISHLYLIELAAVIVLYILSKWRIGRKSA